MTISPEIYLSEHKEKSLKELIKKRNKLIKDLHSFENIYILDKTKIDDIDLVITCPSPETIYKYNNIYLHEITNLIEEKLETENQNFGDD